MTIFLRMLQLPAFIVCLVLSWIALLFKSISDGLVLFIKLLWNGYHLDDLLDKYYQKQIKKKDTKRL